MGFPCGSAGKESAYNAGHLGLIPGLGRSPRRERVPTPVFWPGESHGLYSPWGRKESGTTERLSLSLSTCDLGPDKANTWDVLFIRMEPFDMVLHKRNESKLLESFNIQEKESKKYLKNQQI